MIGSVHWVQGRYGEALSHLGAALAIAREVGNRQLEGMWLIRLGRVHRLSGGLDAACSHQEDALTLLRETGDQSGIGECLCEQGHLRLVAGEMADDELAEARVIADALSVGPKTDLGKAVARLERAVEAHGRRERLYYGQCLGDFPVEVREGLESGS
jgi:hypothetical protein